MKNNYKVIYYFSEEDQCYLAFAPELPGCFADGKTIHEAFNNLDVIITEWIETAIELGRDLPPATSETYVY